MCSFIVAALVFGVMWWGAIVTPGTLEVKEVELKFANLPDAFDGYRIVQWSDAHLGTYNGRTAIVEKQIDAINDLKADMICFTGDLVSRETNEALPYRDLLARLHAPDGVYSVLGNHDYAEYIEADEAIKTANCREVVKLQKSMGWTLLNNSHRSIVRDGDSIIIAGTENWGDLARSPKRGDVRKAVEGVDSSRFILMITHDPVAWREKVIPGTHAQLTLSGHTHGAQFSLFGWSPLSLLGREWGGFYTEGDSTGRQRTLYVTTGVGALVPFRFNMPGEIVVLTLHKTEKQ
jgi:predicted MPP superfamily phosphohydrolase